MSNTTNTMKKRLFPSFRAACKHFQLANPTTDYDDIVRFVRRAVKIGEITIGKAIK